MRADPEIANGSQSLDARVHHGDGAGLASETVVPSRRWAAGIFVPSECIAVANPLQPDPRHDKSKGNGEMRGFFAPLRMTDTLPMASIFDGGERFDDDQRFDGGADPPLSGCDEGGDGGWL